MSRLSQLLSDRRARRLGEGRRAQARIVEALRKAGFEAYPFGSMVTGSVHEDSDADVLVAGQVDELEVLRIAEEASEGFPFDTVVLEDIPPEERRFVLETVDEDDLRALQKRTGQK